METTAQRRKRKLRALCDRHGLDAIAAKASIISESLEQILKGVLLPEKKDGTRSHRGLGSAAARKIEDAFQLGRGWFDTESASQSAPSQDTERQPPSDQEWAALDLMRAMPPDVREAWLVDGLARTQQALQATQDRLSRLGIAAPSQGSQLRVASSRKR